MNPFIDNIQIFKKTACGHETISPFKFLKRAPLKCSIAITGIAVSVALLRPAKYFKRTKPAAEEEDARAMRPTFLARAKVETLGIASYDPCSDCTRQGIITRQDMEIEPRSHSPNLSGGNDSGDKGCVFFTGLFVDISARRQMTDVSSRSPNPFDNGLRPPAKIRVDNRPKRSPQNGRGSEGDDIFAKNHNFGGEDVRRCPSCGNQLPVFIFGQKSSNENGLQFGGAGLSRNQGTSAAISINNGLEEPNKTSECPGKPRPQDDTSNALQSKMHSTPSDGKKRSRRRTNRNRTSSFKPAQGRGGQKFELDLSEARAAFAAVYEAPRELIYMGTEDV